MVFLSGVGMCGAVLLGDGLGPVVGEVVPAGTGSRVSFSWIKVLWA
ncbi:hypothetical protein [Streptomyces adustus]|nr:hypothetical protein [Streptomyces adustus]